MSEKDETKDSDKPSTESEAKPTAAEKAAAAAVTNETEDRDDDDGEDDDEEESDPNAREAKHGPGSAEHGTPAPRPPKGAKEIFWLKVFAPVYARLPWPVRHEVMKAVLAP